MSNHVIYIPGLGDHRSYGQNLAIKLWRLFGLTPHYFPLGWSEKEYFDRKLAHLLKKVELLNSSGHSVSLVGVSAGASAVLNAYAASPEKISKVICISGKINNIQAVQSHTFRESPDFKESLARLNESIGSLKSADKTKNILSIHPWRDQTVPIGDMLISGAKEKAVPGWGHASGIFFGVVFGAALIARFITGKIK